MSHQASGDGEERGGEGRRGTRDKHKKGQVTQWRTAA